MTTNVCTECVYYERSRRNQDWGICHKGRIPFVQFHAANCQKFRQRGDRPYISDYQLGEQLEAPVEEPWLEERVKTLESDLTELGSLVHNMHLSSLPAVYRRLSALEAMLGSILSRVDKLEDMAHDHLA